MRLYLVRHGQALAKEEAAARPLSAEGEAEAATMAAALARFGIAPARIFHSGKRRAEQTAEAIAAALPHSPRAEPVAGLKPMDPVDALARQVEQWSEDTLIAGHLPQLETLASQLLCGQEDTLALKLVTAAACCLRRNGQGWELEWLLGPKQLQD